MAVDKRREWWKYCSVAVRAMILALGLFLFSNIAGAQQYQTFAIISDTHIGAPNQIYPAFAAKLVKQQIHTVIHTGDAIDSPGKIGQWKSFLELTGDAVTLYLVPGNHDVKDKKSLAIYLEYFQKTYYSFSDGDTLFIMLNTEYPGQESRIAGEQLAWLKKELTKSFRHKFVFLHEPLYPFISRHGLDRYQEERDKLHRLFVEQGVSLVVAGHDHMYGRMERDNIIYVINATLGGWLPSILRNGDSYRYIVASRKNGTWTFSVKDIEENARDYFVINR